MMMWLPAWATLLRNAWYSSDEHPWRAWTSTPSSLSAAHTSSCVENELQPHSDTVAPPAASARTRTAVSLVRWRHTPILVPEKVFSAAKRSPMRTSACIERDASAICERPREAERVRAFSTAVMVGKGCGLGQGQGELRRGRGVPAVPYGCSAAAAGHAAPARQPQRGGGVGPTRNGTPAPEYM